MLLFILSLFTATSFAQSPSADQIVDQFHAQALSYLKSHQTMFNTPRWVNKQLNRLPVLVAEHFDSKKAHRRGFALMSYKGKEVIVIEESSWNEGSVAQLSIISNIVNALDSPLEKYPNWLDIMEQQEQWERDQNESR